MKRLTLLTILLVVVGLTAGFALDVKPTAELSGFGKVEWGVDLNNGNTGFKNTAEADLTVTLLAEDGSDAHQGEGDWYGWIEISDVELFFTNDETGAWAWNADSLGVEAKIMGLGGDLAIGVYAAPDTGDYTDFVAPIEDDEDGDYNTLDDETSTEVDLGYTYYEYGTFVSYNVNENLMVGLEVVSLDSWDRIDGLPTDPDYYALALDVMATFAPATVKFGANYGIVGYVDPPLGFGINVAVDTDMIDGWIGFDGVYAAAFDYEVGGGVTVTLAEGVTAAVAATYNVNSNDADVEFIFTEPGDAGLVDALDLSVTVWILDITSSLEYEVIVDGGWKMGDWYPNFKVDVGDDTNLFWETTWVPPVLVPVGTYCNVTVGVDYTGIPLTTLGLYWQGTDLFHSDWGDIVVSAKVAY